MRPPLALVVAFVPRRRDAFQVAALGAAVIIAVQLTVSHWFYLYIVWFAPLALVALMAAAGAPGPSRRPRRRSGAGRAPAVAA